MKIAIYLTGLIIDKPQTLPFIKTMFDNFASRNDLQIDFYCHFWDNTNIYPYNIDYNSTLIKVPQENRRSVQNAINVFKPVHYKTTEFASLYPRFVDYYSQIHKHNQWVCESLNTVADSCKFKNIHSNYFLENYIDPVDAFDRWWHLHVNWCRYIHLISQAYTASAGANMVRASGIEYDAVIKWRYDVVADLISNNNKFLNAIRHCVNNNVFYTELAWEGLEWREDLPYDINTVGMDQAISLHDGWWIAGFETNSHMADGLLDMYTNDMIHGQHGQHLHFYKAIKNTCAKIYFTDRIQHNIIRFPDTLPVDYNDRPGEYFDMLYAKNFAAKNQSDIRKPLEFWDKRSQYYTVKYFNFY